jgi:hypothetical protein
VTDVMTWAAEAAPGDKMVYHRGQPGDLVLENGLAQTSTARSARKAEEEGLVVLVQRRIVGSVFNYEAHRISPRVKAWLEKLNASMAIEARWERSASL